jgi:PAS domain S-box-containing protein
MMRDDMTNHDSQQSVLVVDDDPDIVTALQDLLEYEGFHVDCANTCHAALDSIERNFYNAVLLDLGLPDGDGQRILHRLQESDPSLPVIVLTATTSMDRKLGSLTQGAFAHLTKPYHRDELRAILHRAIGMKSLATKAEGIAVALSESEDRFRSVVQSAPDAIIVADEHGYIASWNHAAAAMFQYGADEVLGRPLTILMPMRYREGHEMGIERMRMSGQSKLMGKVVSLHGLRKDGREFPIELSLASWVGSGKTFYSGIIRDVTARTVTEAALHNTVERFQLLTEHLRLVFWITDAAKNELMYVSPSYAEVWGRPCEELYRSPRAWLDAVHPDDRARVLHAAMTKQSVGTYREEYRIARSDGTTRWIRDEAFPIRDTSGVVYRIIGLAEDISREKEQEEAVQRCEDRVRFALASAELGLWDWDRKSRRMYCSGRAMELLGHTNGSRMLSQEEFLSFIYEPDRAEVARALREAQDDSNICAIRHRARRTDGSLHWLVWFGYALKKHGTATRLIGSVGAADSAQAAKTSSNRSAPA